MNDEIIQIDTSKIFVYNGKEVKLTGRYAKRETRRKAEVLYEIKPCDDQKILTKFNTWVKITELFEIKEIT